MAFDESPDVAFVLSGGAALGAIQVGMLRALHEGLRRLISKHVAADELDDPGVRLGARASLTTR